MSTDLPIQRDIQRPPPPGAARTQPPPPQPLNATALHHLLHAIARQHTPAEGELVLNFDHLCAALAHVQPADGDVQRSLKRRLEGRIVPEPASPQQTRALAGQDLGDADACYSPELEAYVRVAFKRYPKGFLVWRHAHADVGQTLYERLVQAQLRQVPGQEAAAATLARQLILQLADADRSGPACALLVGPPGSGHAQAARAVAQTLATAAGYAVFEFDMSVIRHEGEVTELDGGKPQWSGSRPGRLTSALHKTPRTVVILHDTDQAVNGAQGALLCALREGGIVDQYGLEDTILGRRHGEGREPTWVDTRHAIFLLTASAGQDFWQHPDMAERLGASTSDARDIEQCALTGLRNAEREYRGEKIHAMHRQVLALLEPHAVVFRPPTWAQLHAAAERAVLEACRRTAAKLHLPVLIAPGVPGGLGDVALAWLASLGAGAGLEQLSPAQAELSLLAPLAQTVVACTPHDGSPQEARLLLAPADVTALHSLLAPMGAEPQRQMARRRCRLRFNLMVQPLPGSAHQPAHWQLQPTSLRWVKPMDFADYHGQQAVAAVVPEARFDQIAGHAAIKAELRQIIALYQRADELRQRGLVLPRGAVLHGPPGTGKTLLAQATAAEADMAFIPTTGAELLHADTVQRVFSLAQRNAPAMVFIDEIDALGRRGQNGNAFDAAINRVLTAIQGFDQRAPVFVLAATNRLHLLDEALVRPGRLDKKLYVGPLDRAGREPLLRRLLAHLPPNEQTEASLQRLLSFSDGMTGADLGEVLREASLRELRAQENPGEPQHLGLDEALELLTTRRLGEKAQQERDPAFLERIATHEAGHALVLAALRPDLTIQQVSIVGREQLQGHLALSTEDKPQTGATADSRLKDMAIALAGREAERLRYPDTGPSEGGAADLYKARVIAFLSVAHRGLDDGPDGFACFSVLNADDEDRSLWPEQVKHHLWQRVQVWMHRAQDLAHRTLQAHEPALLQITRELLAHDCLPGDRVHAIVAEHARPN